MSSPPPKSEAKKVQVDSYFQRMARRPGGLDRSRAVEAATVQLDKLEPEYHAWLSKETADLVRSVEVLWEALEAVDTNLAAAERHCRQIGDVAGTMHFDLVTFVADSLWTMLTARGQNLKLCRDPIACHIDALRLVSRPEYRGKHPKDLPYFTEGLRRVAASASSGPAGIMRAQAANQNISSSEE